MITRVGNIVTFCRPTEYIEPSRDALRWERDKSLQCKISQDDFIAQGIKDILDNTCRWLLRYAKDKDIGPLHGDISRPVEPEEPTKHEEAWYEYEGIKFAVEKKTEHWDVHFIICASFEVTDA